MRAVKRSIIFFFLSCLSILFFSCDNGGDGGSTPTGPSLKEYSGIVIKSEENIDKNWGYACNIDGGIYCCMLYVTVQNTTQEIKNCSLTYNAFDTTGAGIAIADLWVRIPANSTHTFYGLWTVPGRPYYGIFCSRFASFKLMNFQVY